MSSSNFDWRAVRKGTVNLLNRLIFRQRLDVLPNEANDVRVGDD
jgi:hypothetical protein